MRTLCLTLLLIPFLINTGQTFEKVTDPTNPIVITEYVPNYSGAAWIDYNNDGLIDLFTSPRFLFKNIGNGAFEKIETDIGNDITGQSNGISWADYDNDDDLDLFMAGNHSTLYENIGNDSFKEIRTGELNLDEDIRGWAAAWGDYDSDSYVDLIITHPAGFLGGGPTSNHFFQNNGGLLERLVNTPVTQEIAPFTIASFTDYDIDGDLDLFIGSGPAGSEGKDFLYKNNFSQNGVYEFERIVDEQFAIDMQDGQVWNFVDYDNDGDLDGFVTNYGGTENNFYQNNDGVFTNISNELTIAGAKLANVWGDLDNDSDLDVIVTGDSDNDFYINNGDGTFTSIENEISSLLSISATLGDYDEDGDLDLFLSGSEPSLFKNTSNNGNNWILINLEGTASNLSAIGTKVKIKAAIDGNEVWQMREVSAQNSFNGHNSLRVHFGLKNAEIIDSLIIIWPNNFKEVYEDIAVNNILSYIQPIPENYLRANFKSDSIIAFNTPSIQFTDYSFSDPDNQITSWEWDFDNDGNIDATDQNPVWKYDTLGIYSVKLTVSNGIQTKERIKKDYITLIKKPGIPIITEVSPSFTDTTVLKGEEIKFLAAAIDTTDYLIDYEWLLNKKVVKRGSNYNYRARIFPFLPRVDTVSLVVSNGFNQISKIWYINVEDVTGIDDDLLLPDVFGLNQNYPNPFNPSTTIKYQLPENSHVVLKIFNVLGKEIATLVNSNQKAGYYSTNFNADNLASGIYFYSIQASNFFESRKMSLVK